MKNVKFISYDAGAWCLCHGVLTVEIEGAVIRFGDGNYSSFWRSGGSCGFDSDWNEVVTDGPWRFDRNMFPKCFDAYFEDICDLFEDNVPHGCCGGCI